jgi:hypothetical protein
VKGAGASGWWGDADAQALVARGAVERRAHGGAEEVMRRAKRLRCWASVVAAGIRVRVQGGWGCSL